MDAHDRDAHQQGTLKNLLLTAGLAALFAAACSLVLDIDELDRDSERRDAGIPAFADGGIGSEDQRTPCVVGQSCVVPEGAGLCALGETTCTDDGMQGCAALNEPSEERCDGEDSDCDGQADPADDQAHAWCNAASMGSYCAKEEETTQCVPGCARTADCSRGNSCDQSVNRCVCGDGPGCGAGESCVDGRCLCGGTRECGEGESCSATGACTCGTAESPIGSACGDGELCNALGQCQCGDATQAGGPACSGGANPACVTTGSGTTQCGCDEDSICGLNERCDLASAEGRCDCGSEAGPAAGPFCQQGTCTPQTGACGGIIPDGGVGSDAAGDGAAEDGQVFGVDGGGADLGIGLREAGSDSGGQGPDATPGGAEAGSGT